MIKIAETDSEISACFPIIHELRPHLRCEGFVTLIRHLNRRHGFHLVFVEDGGVVAVAGLRFGEWLHCGRYLEIEDFVSSSNSRRKGYGGKLFDWIVDYGCAQNCTHLRLVSGAARVGAHRFYERKGMQRQGCYFSMNLSQ